MARQYTHEVNTRNQTMPSYTYLCLQKQLFHFLMETDLY